MLGVLRTSFRRYLRGASSRRALLVMATLIKLSCTAQAANPGNVIKDGQFVLGLPKPPSTNYSAGQIVGNWKVDAGNIDVNVGYFATPNDVSNSVDLNGTRPGAISQTITTIPGTVYTVKFLLSGNWDSGSDQRTLILQAGPLDRTLSVQKPAGWSRTNMQWKAISYSFTATSVTTIISFRSGNAKGGLGPVIADAAVMAPVEAPKSLDTIPVPTPADLGTYVANKDAAIALGKALFWDMQTGSDGKTACATCHWHAGADVRTRNTLHPGAPGSAFGHQTAAGPALAAAALAEFPGVNLDLTSADFPFHRLENMDQPESDSNPVTFDAKKVVGSQGVISKKFLNIVDGNPVDNGQTTYHPVFNLDGTNVRQVTGRNSPTNINAVYFDRSFWDGRANRYFNGVNPFGNLDPDAKVLKWTTTKKGKQTVGSLNPVSILIDNAALASQAVGPPNSSVEMSWDGRSFRELARKMFSLRPLAQQAVHYDDSVLGQFADGSGRGLKNSQSYQAMIRTAFQPTWWAATSPTADGYTQMEANFSLFWGLSIMMYEATLVSGETPFDHYRKGDSDALNEDARRGLEIFLNEGKCINCHGGPEFAGGTVSDLRGVLSDDGPVELMPMAKGTAYYDNGYYNIGVRQTEEDIGVGASHPVFGPLSYSQQKQNGQDIGKSITVPAGARIAVNGAFKTSTLRNIELTGPYFHNGGSKSLLEVVEFYVRGADFRKTNIADLDPDVDGIPELQGNEAGQLALVEFMKHLTDPRVKYQKAPFDHPELVLPNGHTGIDGGVATDIDFVLPATGREGGAPFVSFEEALKNGE